MAPLSIAICLALAGLMVARDADAVPSVSSNRWGVVVTFAEAVLWIAAALVVAPTLWNLLS